MIEAARHDDDALRVLITASKRAGRRLAEVIGAEGASYEDRLASAAERGNAAALKLLTGRARRMRYLAPTKGASYDPRRPWEAIEQADVADYLDTAGLAWFHVPNERKHKRMTKVLSLLGVKPGVPDVMIMSTPRLPEVRGVALELKRRGSVPSAIRANQREWLGRLVECGWIAEVCRGAGEAVEVIELLYGKQWLY